jgi:hypothetical protein
VISAVPRTLSSLRGGRALAVGFFLVLAYVLASAEPAKAERPGWYANPSVSGPAQVGGTLSLNQGGIKCDNCIGTAVEWTSCTGPGNVGADRPTGGLPFDANPAPGCEVRVPFPGSNTYVIQPNDVGRHIQAHIVADNNDCGERRTDGSQECRMSRGQAYTATVGPIAPAPAPAAPPQPAAVVPAFSALPTISGQPAVGQTLTAQRGTWTGTEPITYAFQWFRCSTALRGCQAIEGATQATYTLVEADVGARITVRVTATNRGGGRAATATLTRHIRPAGAATTGEAATGAVVRAADLRPSERLSVDRVTAPGTIRADATVTLRVRIESRSGALVQGAAVEVFGRPGEIVSATRARTARNGVAVLRVTAGSLTDTQEVVLVVVASKPNDRSPAVRLVTLRVAR